MLYIKLIRVIELHLSQWLYLHTAQVEILLYCSLHPNLPLPCQQGRLLCKHAVLYPRHSLTQQDDGHLFKEKVSYKRQCSKNHVTRYHKHQSTHTVPLKGKLTVTRKSQNSTRDLILNTGSLSFIEHLCPGPSCSK